MTLQSQQQQDPEILKIFHVVNNIILAPEIATLFTL